MAAESLLAASMDHADDFVYCHRLSRSKRLASFSRFPLQVDFQLVRILILLRLGTTQSIVSLGHKVGEKLGLAFETCSGPSSSRRWVVRRESLPWRRATQAGYSRTSAFINLGHLSSLAF